MTVGLPASANALDDLRRIREIGAGGNSAEAMKLAAKQFEAIFIQEMLKSMRKTVPENDYTQSEAGNLYQDMFDQRISAQIANSKGMGLADLIVKQMSRFSGSEAAPVADKPGVTVIPVQAHGAKSSMLEQAKDFIQSILPGAKTAAAQLGVNPLAVLAHAALESGWGKHMPQEGKGQPSFNLFGIKSGKAWQGPVAEAATLEYSGGAARSEQAAFRAYDSTAASVRDYARFLLNNPRYQSVAGQGDDIASYAQRLQQAGYASDPAYADKLLATAQGPLMQNALQQLGLRL